EAGPAAAPGRGVPAADGDERGREVREGGARARLSRPAVHHRPRGDPHPALERPPAVPLLRPLRAGLLHRVVFLEPGLHAPRRAATTCAGSAIRAARAARTGRAAPGSPGSAWSSNASCTTRAAGPWA